MTEHEYSFDPESAGVFTHVLLFRHGKTDGRPGRAERDRGLSDLGTEAVQQVARRLAEEVTTGRSSLEIEMVLHGEYKQAQDTVRYIREAFQSQGAAWPVRTVQSSPKLNPDFFWRQAGKPDMGWVVKENGQAPKPSGARRALLIVGHEPQLSEMSRELLRLTKPPWRQWLGGHTVVIPSAGVCCVRVRDGKLEREDRPALQWLIEPEDRETAELLRAKIRSKMDVAKVFGAVITFALGIVLKELMDREATTPGPTPDWVAVAAGALGLALVLYIAVLYAYDSLLMPSRFWAASRDRRRFLPRVVSRPPSSMNLVMQQNMVWVWTWPFTTANVLVIGAFALLAWAAIGISAGWVIGALVLASGLAWWARRIDLGAQD